MCGKCSTPIEIDLISHAPENTPASPAVRPADASGWSAPERRVQSDPHLPLTPGSALGERYEILQLLGEGGIGAVYKAKDRELDRLVAVKVIRPELASVHDILHRFKQELILVRQVTHRNVIRIFDLGVGNGRTFITMEYVEGQDLKSVLEERNKFPPEQAVDIIQQVCQALEAAHAENVIHRDLKPNNVALDAHGRVVVMDFGLAGSMEQAAVPESGPIIGAPEYTSPEQATGQPVDARSDIFAAGIIFYQLLTGVSPFGGDTAPGAKQAWEKPVPPIELDAAVPKLLSEAVMKCLQFDPARRYQTASDFLKDLALWQAGTLGQIPVVSRWAGASRWLWITIGLAVLLLGSATIMWRNRAPKPTAKHKPVSVLVADFNNSTGDPVFDGTLEPMFTIALEGASFVSSFPRNQAHTVAARLQGPGSKLDGSLARLVAVREGVSVVVDGSITRQGQDYGVTIKVLDAATGNAIAAREIKASSREAVLGAVGKLAVPIRKALGDLTPESAQLAAAETFSAANVEAAHQYAVAQELQFAGKWEEASKAYLQTVELDPDLGRAYAGLGSVHNNLGQRQVAEKYYQMAMARMHRMTDREKYRTRGTYYLVIRNQERAIEELNTLVQQFPADSGGLNNLALAYSYRRDLARAVEFARRAVDIYPKNALLRNNLAVFSMYGGDFTTAEREARAVLELNPAYVKAYIVVGLSELAQGRAAKAVESYNKLETVSARGASLAAAGLADVSFYEGCLNDAIAILEKAAAKDLENKTPNAAANKLTTLASAQLLRGEKAKALAAADRAVAASKQEDVQLAAARVYVGAGREAKARAVAQDLGARLEPDPQAYAKLIEAEILLERGGDPRPAITLLEAGQKTSDTWLGHFDLGRAYLQAHALAAADAELERCLKRRGEATAQFLDEVPTYRLVPPVYYYLGRVKQEGKNPGAAEAFRTFLGIKVGNEDPMAADARGRLSTF